MMTSRGQMNDEWEVDDYNTSSYDPQYPDDNASGGVQLDHCRLYIRNIPKALNDEGLRTAFSKYGTLCEVYLNKESSNKYALVRYETPGEAKLAMTKLNNTEPLGLSITVAHKHKSNQRRDKDHKERSERNNGPPTRNHRERDDISVSSRDRNSRRGDDMMLNGEDLEDSLPALDDEMDADIKMKGIQLELQRLQVQEQSMLLKKKLLQLEAAKKRNFSQAASNSPSNRCVLPDGRVVVRNVHDRSMESRDGDGSFAAGAGDSLTLPALQRDASRACVACGAPADSYCAQCAVTPYCSTRCQRRDWADRHKGVCHNLARLNRKSEAATNSQNEVPNIPTAPALRRPYSPAKNGEGSTGALKKTPQAPYYNNKNRNFNNNRNENGGDNRNDSRYENRNDNRNDNRNVSRNDSRNENRNDGRNDNRNENRNENRSGPGNRNFRPSNRNQNQGQDEEEWGKVATPTSTPVAKPQPEPKVNQEPVKPKPEPMVPKPEPKASTSEVVAAVKPDPKPAAPGVSHAVKVDGLKGPGSLSDVTPAKKIVPKTYLLEALSIGEVVLMSVDANAADCRSDKPGFVCLSMNEKFETEYQNLCEVYVVDCEAIKEDYTPKPGESFSYFNPEDGGWYRARCLTPTLAALIDSCKLVELKSTDRLKILPEKYAECPEFCCLVNAPGVKIGDNLKCTIQSKLPDGFKVLLENVETGVNLGEGEACRWLPRVEYPPPAPTAAISAAPVIPEVPRPDVKNNSKVLLVDATAIDKVLVRPADVESQKKFDAILEEVVLYGRSASALKQPPAKGQVVVGEYEGLHYRALVKRTNVKQNKYLLEYIEFGNLEATTLDKIYECPPNLSLSAVRTEVSVVALQCKCDNALTPAAAQYLDNIKDNNMELLLTLPSGAESAASGSAAILSVVKTNESVNRKVEQMCTPEWKKMEDQGMDVVESKCLMYQDLEYLELPATGCELDILDVTVFEAGTVSACQKGSTHIKRIEEKLTQRMAEYCNSEIGKEPYLPKSEELCVARFPPYPQWFRAVLLEQAPGAAVAKVCYVDYGNIGEVPVNMLRKMLPEFVRGEAALASHIEIKDFPKNATQDMLCRAIEHMQMNDEGRGTLVVTKLVKQDSGMYLADAPALIEAMTGKGKA